MGTALTVCKSDCGKKKEAGDRHLRRTQCWKQLLLQTDRLQDSQYLLSSKERCYNNIAFFAFTAVSHGSASGGG